MTTRPNRILTLALLGLPALAQAAPTAGAPSAGRAPASAPAVTASAPAHAMDVVSKTGFSSATGACTASESWHYGPNVFSEWRDQMRKLLGGGQAVWGFTQALGLRRQAQTVEARSFAEYWVSRSLFEAKLPHIAWSGFTVIAAREPTPETVGVQLAALDCLSESHQAHPAFELPAKVAARLPQYLALAQGDRQKQIVWEYAGNLARARMSTDSTSSEVASAMELLKGSGPHEWLMNGVQAARAGNHSRAIGQLDKFLTAPGRPASLQRFEDHAHLLIARSYFSTQQFPKAQEHLKLVRKSSNELTRALSELSWAYLQDFKYSEAIGTAINLQQGGLRHAFAPEAPMVMAMALNEICQYPESLRAVSTFRKYYEKPYRWLSAYFQSESRPELYPMAVRYLRKDKELALPNKLGSEWVRSPIFLTHQDELNLLVESKDNTRSLARSGSTEQRRLGAQIGQLASDLKTRIRQARASMKGDQELPQSIRNSLGDLRLLLTHYQRFRQGAPVWRTVLANFDRTVTPTRAKLVRRINEDLASRSQKMLYQLEEIAENNQLIEVEIYNGASQDIIWQNAHPDYKKIAQDMREDHDRRGAAKVWDWGRAPASDSEDGGEIWEDELGSFKADLYDNCSSKDKYLKLKRLSYAK